MSRRTVTLRDQQRSGGSYFYSRPQPTPIGPRQAIFTTERDPWSLTKLKERLQSNYLLESFIGGLAAAGCAGRKLARGGIGLLPPFGFFTSRFRLPRPFAMNILLIA